MVCDSGRLDSLELISPFRSWFSLLGNHGFWVAAIFGVYLLAARSFYFERDNMGFDNFKICHRNSEVEFLKFVRAGDQHGAINVATSHLGPLALKVPDLLKPMKETLVALLRSAEEPFGKHFSIDVLATSLQVAVGRKLGVEEPQLMKIIKATLRSHIEWFKLRMCKDQFEGLLWINSLNEFGSPLLGNVATKSTADTCNQGSSPATVSSGNMRMQEDGRSPNQTSSSEMGCEESAILKVTNFAQ